MTWLWITLGIASVVMLICFLACLSVAGTADAQYEDDYARMMRGEWRPMEGAADDA